MLSKKDEYLLKNAVSEFVKNLNGFYRKHCSDQMLIALIMEELQNEPVHLASPESVGSAIIDGADRADDEAYLVASWIFETVFEHRCQAGGNGHHMAQKFARHMVETFSKKD